MKKFGQSNLVTYDILELISEDDKVVVSFNICSTDSLRQVSIVLTMKKLYILKKDNLGKSILEIPADEIVFINYGVNIKKSILKCDSKLIGVLRVVDIKKKIFEVTIEDIPLQNFEKPLYRIKKELEIITGKNWQIIQPIREILIKRTDVNENELLGNVVKNMAACSTKPSLSKIVEKTDSSNLQRISESEMTGGLLQTLQDVFSNPSYKGNNIFYTRYCCHYNHFRIS
ncbi:hypothetical protein [Methanothermococcus thermolithotrophicus]|uniref:hypothetical protein n=1 Tax=Methanothermococcus thermolithotrophicus TaxID=2186 RepID=UPI00035DC875|nr:hypothetical protein [Methanothermococcus thermolithotrophicus]MDK2946621.1 hypothetical protein [Geotoga sp.]